MSPQNMLSNQSGLYWGPMEPVSIPSLTAEQLEAWRAFVSQDPHMLLLQLNWLMRNVTVAKRGGFSHLVKTELSVIWHLIITYRHTGSPPTHPVVLTEQDWNSRYAVFFGCSPAQQPSFSRTESLARMNRLGWVNSTERDAQTLLEPRPGMKKLKLRWLNWPCLHEQWSRATYPPVEVLESYYYSGSDVVALYVAYILQHADQWDADGYLTFMAKAMLQSMQAPWYSQDELVSTHRRLMSLHKGRHIKRDQFIQRDRSRERLLAHYALGINQAQMTTCRKGFYGTDVLGL